MLDQITYSVILSAAVAGGLFVLSALCYKFYEILSYKWTRTLEITSDNLEQWRWITEFLETHHKPELRDWRVKRGVAVEPATAPVPVKFRFAGCVFKIVISKGMREPVISQDAGDVRPPLRRAVISSSTATAEIFERFLCHIRDEHLQLHVGKLDLYGPLVYYSGTQWKMVGHVSKRDLATVTLETTVMEDTVDDLTWFMKPETRELYKKYGLQYRRGMLFEGPPGCGKSSFIVALASKFRMPIYRASLNDPALTDMKLQEMFAGTTDLTKDPKMIILEDVDCMFESREPEEEDSPTAAGGPRKTRASVTLSGLLQALDGVGAVENAVLIMTTNHPEKLDAALLRPGRVDRRVRFSHPSDDTIRRHFLKYFAEPQVEQFLEVCNKAAREHDTPRSMALVQCQIVKWLEQQHKSTIATKE